MVNPLAVPVAAMEAVLGLPRALEALRRSADLLERAVDAAVRLDRRAEAIVGSLDRAEVVGDKLVVGGDKLVEASLRAEDFVDRLLASAELLVGAAADVREDARAATVALEGARPTAEALHRLGEPLLEAALLAREQLVATQVELERANAQIARVIDMSGPLERASDRLERIVARVRGPSAR